MKHSELKAKALKSKNVKTIYTNTAKKVKATFFIITPRQINKRILLNWLFYVFLKFKNKMEFPPLLNDLK